MFKVQSNKFKVQSNKSSENISQRIFYLLIGLAVLVFGLFFLVGYDMLTPTEREILEALADGSSPREISEQRNCSESTIATHRKNIYRKLGIHKAYQLKICIALLRQEREAQN